MSKKLIFEEMGEQEKILLLHAYDYSVDKNGFILDKTGSKIRSEEIPDEYLTVTNAGLVSGSLGLIHATPSSISNLIRKQEEDGANPG